MNAKVDVSNIVLKTKRLILRPWKLEDLDDFYEYAKVDGVGQMAGWLPHENKEKSLMILNMFIEEKKTFAIVLNVRLLCYFLKIKAKKLSKKFVHIVENLYLCIAFEKKELP